MHNTDKYFYDVYNIFRRKTIMWKKSVFGNLNQKIEDINKKLEHTLYQLETNYSENIHKEFLNLEKEHQLLLKQKELYWKQRARITWLKEGDNNTKNFHAYASNRRRRNLIQSIKLENNNWITDLESIQSVFIENFKRLYSSTQTNMFSFHTLDCPSVKESDHENLINIPNNEEILKGLKCIGPDKAPGPDGLNAHFFVTYWDSVGPHIVKIIRDFFISNTIIHPINQTRIILIPKNNNPYLINHFRPISLCNFTYKIISNILVNRIRSHMDNLISPLQNAFVPKRYISDNIALAHELLHTMKSKKCKTYYMAFKIDLEKAYDRIEWNFIKNALIKYNFPPQLISWIMTAIESVQFSLLINGFTSENWKPQRGIR